MGWCSWVLVPSEVGAGPVGCRGLVAEGVFSWREFLDGVHGWGIQSVK